MDVILFFVFCFESVIMHIPRMYVLKCLSFITGSILIEEQCLCLYIAGLHVCVDGRAVWQGG